MGMGFLRGAGRRRLLVVAGGLAIAGCTKEPGGGTSFGGPTASASVTLSAGNEAGTEESSGDDTDGSTTSVETTVEPTSSTTMPVDDSTTGAPTTMPPTTLPGSSEDMGDGGGGQPQDGMYSHCLVGNDCAAPTNVCLQIQDENMVTQDGFCTSGTCANAAVDCDPSPGGTATPICIGITLNMMPAQACALDCSGGKTCPTGMMCWSLDGGLMLCA